MAANPAFKETSPARCVQRDGPYPVSEPDIVYSDEDDAAIDQYHRAVGRSVLCVERADLIVFSFSHKYAPYWHLLDETPREWGRR